MCKWCRSPVSSGDFCNLECREKFKNLLEKRIAYLKKELSKGRLNSTGLTRLQNYLDYHAILVSEEL